MEGLNVDGLGALGKTSPVVINTESFPVPCGAASVIGDSSRKLLGTQAILSKLVLAILQNGR